MKEILCSFDEDGTLTAQLGGSVEIFFDSDDERERFESFAKSGALARAYKEWQKTEEDAHETD